VDWNADGRKDLVVGSSDGRLNLFLNEGSNASPVFLTTDYVVLQSGDTLSVGGYATPAVTDWNEDGLVDLVVGEGYGYLHLFMNQGIVGDPQFAGDDTVMMAGGYLWVGFGVVPFVGDWDGDGKKDLVLGDDEGYVSVCLNQGLNEKPSFDGYSRVMILDDTLDVFYDAAPFPVDWNDDGALDLVVGQNDGWVIVSPCVEVSIALTADTSIVNPGSALGYTRELTNHVAEVQTFFCRMEAYRGARPVFRGPVERRSLLPKQRLVEHLEQPVPVSAPPGLYQCWGRIGVRGAEWFHDGFPLTVTPK
jgi:hypothetical protein